MTAARSDDGAGDDAKSVAEGAALRLAELLRRTQGAVDREQIRDFLRRPIDARTVILDKIGCSVSADRNLGAGVECIIDKFFEGEPPQAIRRDSRLLA